MAVTANTATPEAVIALRLSHYPLVSLCMATSIHRCPRAIENKTRLSWISGGHFPGTGIHDDAIRPLILGKCGLESIGDLVVALFG